jgi:hypothetical protein
MARYRIVRRPSRVTKLMACYDVDRFSWPFFWECIGAFLTIEGAQAFADECKRLESNPPIKREVVWESEQ